MASVLYSERVNAIIAAAVKAEREACAKIAEDGVDVPHPTVKGCIMRNFGKSPDVAAAIRNRK